MKQITLLITLFLISIFADAQSPSLKLGSTEYVFPSVTGNKDTVVTSNGSTGLTNRMTNVETTLSNTQDFDPSTKMSSTPTNVVITPSASTVGLQINMAASPTANPLEIRNSSNSVVMRVANNGGISSGVFFSPGGSQSISNADGTGIVFNTAVSNALSIDYGTGSATFAAPITSTQYKLSALNTAPASSTATGVTGEIRITATYIYICTATNTWVRAALSTF